MPLVKSESFIFRRYSPHEEAIFLEGSTDLGMSCKWWQWIRGEILMCFKKKVPKSDPYFLSY